MENEIEMLSVEVGPGLLRHARTLLGDDLLADLSFLTDHVRIDVGHTTFNRRQMAAFLATRPGDDAALAALAALVDAGTAALDAYRAFVADCVASAGCVPIETR